jgi:hypothetical protein
MDIAMENKPQPLDEQVVRAQALLAAATVTAGAMQGYTSRGRAPQDVAEIAGLIMREMFKKSLFLLLFEGQEDKGITE